MIAWIHQYRPRSAWYALSDSERDLLAERWDACAARASDAGGTRGGPFSIRGQSLFERLEDKLREQRSPLRRAAVELAKEWRTDRALRRLEAMLVVADSDATFILSGSGDVIEPDDGVCAIGSGGAYALSAARALVRHTELSARQIVETAMGIAAEVCIYTNANLTIEELP